jgi:hypothetical protein
MLVCASRYRMTLRGALAFVRRHGVVLESAKGPVPNLAEAVVGARIRGNWWGHPKGKEIFWTTRGVRDSKQLVVCRAVAGKVTYIHRRLWPALVKLAPTLPRKNLAAVREIHTGRGRHEIELVPFPRWVPAPATRQAARLTAADAVAALGAWVTARRKR